MSGIDFITDPRDDQRLDVFRCLRDRDLKGRLDLFVGEGPLTVERMLTLPGVAVSVLATEKLAPRFRELASADVQVLAAAEASLGEIAGFPFHRGVMAVGRRAPFEGRVLADVLPPEGRPATILLVDGVTNVDNIGLLFRNAAAFACDAVILSESTHDPLYRKALRVSLGHVLSLPYVRVVDWAAALRELIAAEVEICAAALGPNALALDDYLPPERVALALGQEFSGVSPQTLELAQRSLRIPMAPGVDSLNVAAASAVCLHRLSRGRRL